MRRTSPFLIACAAVLTLVAAVAIGARNSSGTYSLPSGNPVISGTTITSSWANQTLSDIGTELTNSLDRSGRGAMLAPLKVTDGSLSAPGLTFSAEQTSGLYRAGSGDVRISLLDTQVQQWTSAASTISLPLTCSDSLSVAKGLTVTTSVTDGTAVVATGDEGGAGVSATGGADGGIGLLGNGGALGGIGVKGVGDYDGGTGGYFVGGFNGIGVRGFGAGLGQGGIFQGGTNNATGVEGVGGSANGVGVVGIGTGTGEGGHFTAGTAATGATPENAVVLQGGYLSLNGVANPNSGTAITNTVTPINFSKAWARVDCTSGACSISDGFNVSSVSTGPTSLVLTFASSMLSSTSGAVVVTPTSSAFTQCVASKASTTTLTVSCWSPTGTSMAPNGASFTGGLNIVLFDRQ